MIELSFIPQDEISNYQKKSLILIKEGFAEVVIEMENSD